MMKRKEVLRLTTGSKELDKLLGSIMRFPCADSFQVVVLNRCQLPKRLANSEQGRLNWLTRFALSLKCLERWAVDPAEWLSSIPKGPCTEHRNCGE